MITVAHISTADNLIGFMNLKKKIQTIATHNSMHLKTVLQFADNNSDGFFHSHIQN